MPDASPWLTIVTVVKDDAAGIKRTLASLSEQDLSDVEYLVIDSSADKSSVPAALEERGLTGVYRWAEPAGIYPAMNLGLAQATGRFVYFANAGDELLPDVLARVRVAVGSPDCVWAFGSVDFIQPDGSIVHEPAWSWPDERARLLARRRFPPHQGTFLATAELRRQGGFDTRYRIAADYLSVLRAGEVAPPVELRFPIARFAVGGTSSTSWRAALGEFHRARLETYRPRGWSALRERWHTADTLLRTAAHRALADR